VKGAPGLALGFSLDPRLAAESDLVLEGELCRWLLVDDARYDWLVLVPRVAGAEEWVDLPPEQQAGLLDEVNQAADVLRALGRCDKLNIGALGNVVRQLHVHVVARRVGDAAWPGPVWGFGAREPLAPDARMARVAALRQQLAR
jgi:diadenosine tetraphosphate (Ap4A) HIT family hydrolase